MLLLVAPPTGLRVTKVGRNVEIIIDEFPAVQRARYPLFQARCGKCHSLDRPIEALSTGITPVTGGSFEDAEIKEYVIRMMRKRGSGITKTEAAELQSFLIYARALARSAPKVGIGTNTSTSAKDSR